MKSCVFETRQIDNENFLQKIKTFGFFFVRFLRMFSLVTTPSATSMRYFSVNSKYKLSFCLGLSSHRTGIRILQ